jgi:hypothetical protein
MIYCQPGLFEGFKDQFPLSESGMDTYDTGEEKGY